MVLDLDGTLISSFTPRRAPRLPPGVTSYTVGRGGQLNPQGVFVVERPGLKEFFTQLSSFAGRVSANSPQQVQLTLTSLSLSTTAVCVMHSVSMYMPAALYATPAFSP